MRKSLEIVSLAGLAVMIGLTVDALAGPHRITGLIPTHFGLNGQPDAWGSRWTLLAMPAIAAALYLLMTIVARYPGAFNFPVRVTPANRARLETLAVGMIAWLKAEVMCLFCLLQIWAVNAARQAAARQAHGALSPWFMPISLVVIFGTIVWYIAVMRRAAAGQAKLRAPAPPRSI